MPTPRDLGTLEHKLSKRGFKREDVYLHECPDCHERAVIRYAILGRIGGRDIGYCQACGGARSHRSGGGMNDRVEDPTFDLDEFLR